MPKDKYIHTASLFLKSIIVIIISIIIVIHYITTIRY